MANSKSKIFNCLIRNIHPFQDKLKTNMYLIVYNIYTTK